MSKYGIPQLQSRRIWYIMLSKSVSSVAKCCFELTIKESLRDNFEMYSSKMLYYSGSIKNLCDLSFSENTKEITHHL